MRRSAATPEPTPKTVTRAVLDALGWTLDVPIATVVELSPGVRRRIVVAVAEDASNTASLTTDDGRFLARRFHRSPASIVVVGPYRLRGDEPGAGPVIDAAAEARAEGILSSAATALSHVEDERLLRLELASQLEVASRSVLAITAELELSTVLRRIVDLAREIAGAKYAALGVPNERGELEAFITSGLSEEDEARISHRPLGLGLLGLLLTEPRMIRLSDLSQHPASAGFPANHPPMTSFLGVPIMARGRNLGNLYLTEKLYGPEFTDNDARLIELLARHAAVAIENARLYNAIEFQQQRLQLILDQLPEAVILAESNPDRISLANRHTFDLLGWSAALPMPLDEFFSRNQRFRADGTQIPAEALSVTGSLRDGVTINRREVRIVRPDGTQITALINSTPLTDEHGNVTAAISVFQDITQIKDAEQLKDDFLSLVSHELRTPITTMLGGSTLLLNEWDRLDRDTQRDILTDMAGETRRLSTLIENMVQLANIRAGRMVMESEIVHVRRAIERAVEKERQVASDRAFTIDTEPNLFAVGDPGLIDQLLRNLVHNAVKYTPAGTPIEVSAMRQEEVATSGFRSMVAVAVRDYGAGINETDLPFIFDRFHRSPEAILRGTPGMGLGLYLARNLVEAHDGRIWVEHPNGGGMRIVFTIPEAVEDELDEE